MERIARIVAEFYAISYPKMFTRTRKGSYPYARQMTMYLTRKFYPEVTHREAAGFFNRDHATSVHAFSIIDNHINYNKQRKKEYRKIIAEVRLELSKVNYIFDGKLKEICNPCEYEIKKSK